MATAATVATKFTAVDKFSMKVAKMSAATQSFAAKTEIMAARANRAFRSMVAPIGALTRQLGSLGIFIGGAAVIGAVGGAIGIFKDFEQANANLSSVLGKERSEITALIADSKRLGASTSFTAAEVAGLQTEYAKLGFTQNEILNSTESTLALAAATGTDLAQTATQVGSALRAFGLDASESTRVADVFAASTSKSALDMEKLNVAMSKVAPVAASYGFSIEETTALMGKLSDAGFDASTMATSTRSILLNLADGNGKLAKALGGPVKTLPELTQGLIKLRDRGVDLGEALGLTDKRSVAAFLTFLEGAESTNALSEALKAAGGTAQTMADKQLDTLQGSLTKLSSAYEGFILAQEDGQGSFAKFLRTSIDTVTEMFALGAGVAKAENELSKQEKTIRKYANITITVLKIIGGIIAAMILFKAILIVTSVALGAYNIAMGVMGAVTGVANVAIGKSAIAMNAYKIALAVATAAQWLWAAALNAGIWPITLIAVGIAGLIALVTMIVKKWDEWGAAVTLFFGPLGFIISLIQSFRKNWDMVVQSFETGGIIGALKAIGKVFLDAILYPLQQMLEIAANIPGKIGEFAAKGAAQINDFRSELGVEGGAEPTPALNPEAERHEALTQRIESTTSRNSTLTIMDQTGRGQLDSNDPALDLQVIPSFNFGG